LIPFPYFWQIDFIQMEIDMILCEMQAELGANTMLAVSIAACKAGAAEKEVLLFC
jgi:enolase